MKFKIYHEAIDGSVDSFVVYGETYEEVLFRVQEEILARDWNENHCWSEGI